MGTGQNGREWELITLALLRDLRQLISILPPGGGERMGVIGSANDRKSTNGWLEGEEEEAPPLLVLEAELPGMLGFNEQ